MLDNIFGNKVVIHRIVFIPLLHYTILVPTYVKMSLELYYNYVTYYFLVLIFY